MKTKLGVICMILGVLLLGGALGLLVYNNSQDRQAAESSAQVLEEIRAEIAPTTSETNAPDSPAPTQPEAPLPPVEMLKPEDLIMTEKNIQGWNYIGYLAIPDLDLALPVLSQWSYPGLQLAPARYAGSVKGRDLVIVAHNFANHFGKINTLTEGATVTFTDMDGEVWIYQVVVRDVVSPSAVEEVTSGDYALTLLTCTFGGQNRICVYCDLVE